MISDVQKELQWVYLWKIEVNGQIEVFFLYHELIIEAVNSVFDLQIKI